MNEKMDHAALIDRLAAGELDDAVRRDLFEWLDREPARWRRCALALLEARELEEAFGAWQSEVSKPTVRWTRPPAAPLFRPSALFALAACVMVAFALGIFARGFSAAPAPAIVQAANSAGGNSADGNSADGTSADGKASGTSRREPADALINTPADRSAQRPTAVAAAPTSEKQSDRIPPYVRSQLERRGYQVSSHPARLPVVLPDGRRVMVPVDQFQLNYVGQRTY